MDNLARKSVIRPTILSSGKARYLDYQVYLHISGLELSKYPIKSYQECEIKGRSKMVGNIPRKKGEKSLILLALFFEVDSKCERR